MGAPPNIAAIKTLSEQSRAFLLEHAQEISARKGDTLISKGDSVSGVFLVRDGRLRVYAINEKGKQATLYRLKQDEFCLLSLNSSLTGGRYPGWVSVESSTAKVLAIQGRAFRSLFSKEEAMRDLMLESLTTTISHLLLCIDEALLSDLKERLLSFLIRNRNDESKVGMTHQELADHMGVARESISRELALLQSQGFIQKGRNYIEVIHH